MIERRDLVGRALRLEWLTLGWMLVEAAVGLSNVTVADIQKARQVVPIVTVQNRYNLTDRSSEAVLAYCEAEGLGFEPRRPVTRPNGFQDRRIRPLCHPSGGENQMLVAVP